MKTEPTYEDLTAEAEKGIKQFVRYANMARNLGSTADWIVWKNKADDLYRLWRETVDDRPGKAADSERLLALIPCDDRAASLEDRSETLQHILDMVADDSLWTAPHLVAFNRGRITGMCHRVGIGLDRDE